MTLTATDLRQKIKDLSTDPWVAEAWLNKLERAIRADERRRIYEAGDDAMVVVHLANEEMERRENEPYPCEFCGLESCRGGCYRRGDDGGY